MITLARVRRTPAPLLLLALFSLPAQGQFGGTGADGAFAPTGNITLNPDEGGASGRNGEFHYTSFYVPEGTVTTIAGETNGQPTKIFAQGDVQIDGRLYVQFGYSMGEYQQGQIGYPGSCHNNHASHSISGNTQFQTYNSEYLHLPLGGPSGYSSNSHRGGGFVEIEAGGSILITGSIEANGQSYGAGGAISLRSRDLTYLASSGHLHAHTDNYENGYIRVESSADVVLEGEMRPLAIVDNRQRMLGDVWTVAMHAGNTLTKTTPWSGSQEVYDSLAGGYGVATSLRGAVWVSFPDIDQIHPYGRDGLDLLPGKVISTGGNSSPRGIAVDRLDRVWVACSGDNRLRYYDPAGRQRLNLAVGVAPYAVAVDREGDCWLTCTGAGKLYQYQIDGTQLLDLDIGPGPRGVTVDHEGHVWVAMAGSLEATEGFVNKYGQDGSLLGSFQVGLRPAAIAIDGQERVWVANEGEILTDPGTTVSVLDLIGNHIGTYTVGLGPNSISIGGDGTVWVVNGGTPFEQASSLMQLDPDTGQVLDEIALADRSIAFGDPIGSKLLVAVDPDGDADGDDSPNYYELYEGGDPFNQFLTPTSDCNENGIPDVIDIGDGSEDCNGNSVPDECDIGTVSEDCNLNGIPDECDVMFGGASTDCNENGLPDECDVMDDPSLDLNANGILDDCECVYISYCEANPNSTGTGATFFHSGTLSCMLNNLTLITTNCPPNQFGIYFYGSGQIDQSFGAGRLCTDGPYTRLPAVYTGPSGVGAYSFNINFPPTVGMEVDPGETWNFQFWFRDGGSQFNTSNALQLTFCE
jgi:streptogramin lyase